MFTNFMKYIISTYENYYRLNIHNASFVNSYKNMTKCQLYLR